MGLGTTANLNELLTRVSTEAGAWALVEHVHEFVARESGPMSARLLALKAAGTASPQALAEADRLSRELDAIVDSFDPSNPAHRTREFASAWIDRVIDAVMAFNVYVDGLGSPRIVKSTEDTAIRTFFWSLGAIAIALGLGYVVVRNIRR